jgi:hypothetical protein
MKSLLSVLFLGILAVGNTSSTVGQDPGAGGPQDKRGPTVKALSSLVSEIFAPVTEKLNLTQEQQLQIISIIIETEVRADPLLQTLATIDQQLSELSLSEVLDEDRLKGVSEHQGAIMSEVIQMRIRAKAQIYRLLTPEQKAIVAQQFRRRARLDGNLGPITIY